MNQATTGGEILSTKYEILNNIEALMTKIQNKMSFAIWIWNFESPSLPSQEGGVEEIVPLILIAG